MYESILGIDMHKRNSVVSVVGPTGPERATGSFTHDPAGLAQFAAFLRAQPGPRFAVVEAAGGSHWMLRFLRERCGCDEVRLVHAASVGARAGVAKTDRRDALKLATRARTCDLVYCYEATEDEREARMLLRARVRLVRQRTRMINLIRAILAQENLSVTASDLAGKKGLRELDGLLLMLPECARICVQSYRKILESLDVEILRLHRHIEEACREGRQPVTDRARRLIGEVPSVRELSALGVAAELGDPDRFENGRQVASYAGLAPTTRASGERSYHGPLSKRGNPLLRWWVGQIAVRLLISNAVAREWAARHPRLHGNKRRSALARRLLVGIWASFRTGEVFDLRRALGLSHERAAPSARPSPVAVPG